jgi:hypothetical protein
MVLLESWSGWSGHYNCAAEALTASFQKLPFMDTAIHLHGFQMAGSLVVYAFVGQQRKQLVMPLESTHACIADLKVKVAMWALNKLHRQHGMQDAWGLLALPSAVLTRILMCADADSLRTIVCTCKGLQQAADDDLIWRHRMQEDFGRVASQVRLCGRLQTLG